MRNINIDIGYITIMGDTVVAHSEKKNTCYVKCVLCNSVNLKNNKTVKYKKALCNNCYTVAGYRKDRLLNAKIGRWYVKEFLNRKNPAGYNLYLCICDCGTVREVATNSLDGRSLSCGCLCAELTRQRYVNYPKKSRKTRDVVSKIWRRLVKYIIVRDVKCILCDGDFKLTPHHLDGWNWCEEKRYDEENLVLLCNYCHEDFHSKYLKGNNTKAQFLEYTQNYNLDNYFSKIILHKQEYGFVYK
jgi:hypothetical protein